MASNLVRLLGRNSPQFQHYLNQQTPERASEILAAERAYSASRQFVGENPDERAYEESFLGFTESPAGGVDRG